MSEELNPEDLDIADELIAERRSAAPGELPDDMPALHRKLIGAIDSLNDIVGKLIALLVIPLCLAMVYEVIVRKFGTSPAAWFQEINRIFTDPDSPSLLSPAPTLWAYDISRMLYGAMFMLGAGYALARGVHIRADFMYRNWSPRTQGIVDLILYTLLFFPGMAYLLWYSSDYAFAALTRGERGMDTAWMPLMWPVKTCIPVGVLLLLIQGVSEWLKSLYAAKNGRWPV